MKLKDFSVPTWDKTWPVGAAVVTRVSGATYADDAVLRIAEKGREDDTTRILYRGTQENVGQAFVEVVKAVRSGRDWTKIRVRDEADGKIGKLVPRVH